MMPTTVDMLFEEAKTLPESLQLEVLHFASYLRTKSATHTPNAVTIAALQADDSDYTSADSIWDCLDEGA